MRKRIPLNAVRAFEATARHGSVAKAADELCVTPTAVSHQIRLLEDFLQTKLFLRRNGRIDLAPEARGALGKLNDALDMINDAILGISAPALQRGRVTVGASASVASMWLLPQLQEFCRLSPSIDISVRTFITRAEAIAQGSDLWICNWQPGMDLRIDPLLEEDIIPVCAPEVAERYHNNPEALLAQAPLIHVDRMTDPLGGTYPDWERFLRETGVSRADVTHGLRFNQASTGIDAAAAGFGLILGRSILVDPLLKSGKLVKIGQQYPIRSPYFVVSQWKTDQPEAVDKFRNWLLSKGTATVRRPEMALS